MEPSVLLVERNDLLRKGLSCCLAKSRRIRRIAEAANAEEALEVVERDRIDVAVLGMDLAGATGVDVVERLAEGRSQTKFVVIVGEGGHGELDRMTGSRVLGLLGHGSSGAELLEAIECAASGRRYVSAALEDQLVCGVRSGGKGEARGNLLTAREKTVLRMIGEGESNRGIAAKLGVSTRTVDTHRLRLMSELGIHKTAGLVRIAIREGFVEA